MRKSIGLLSLFCLLNSVNAFAMEEKKGGGSNALTRTESGTTDTLGDLAFDEDTVKNALRSHLPKHITDNPQLVSVALAVGLKDAQEDEDVLGLLMQKSGKKKKKKQNKLEKTTISMEAAVVEFLKNENDRREHGGTIDDAKWEAEQAATKRQIKRNKRNYWTNLCLNLGTLGVGLGTLTVAAINMIMLSMAASDGDGSSC